MKSNKNEVLVPMTLEQHEWWKKNSIERDKEISDIKQEYESQIQYLHQELSRIHQIELLNGDPKKLTIYIDYDKKQYNYDSEVYSYIENILRTSEGGYHYHFRYLPYEIDIERTKQYEIFSKIQRDISNDVISKVGEVPYDNYKKLNRIPKWIRKLFNAL